MDDQPISLRSGQVDINRTVGGRCKLHVAITGASRGLGAALAMRYAEPGVQLTLIARTPATLRETAEEAARTGAMVSYVAADVRDGEVLGAALLAADRTAPIDILIANAGVGGARSMAGPDGEDPEAAREVAGVNFLGVVNAIAPLVGPMVRRRSGHIVIVSSVAALTPLPLAPTYAASKAAAANYARNLRLLLAPKGVDVTIAFLGFVDTQMSADVGLRPFLVSAEAAAEAVQRAVGKRSGRLVYPWQFRIVAAVAPLLPDWALRTGLRRWGAMA